MTNGSSYIGKQIGNYRIVAELASGGFGSVYQGKHIIFTERPVVAIKLLHAHLGSQKEHDQFLQEARLLEKLKHPHILPIIDAGIHEGFPYLVAEYAPNGSLRNRLQHQSQRPLPIQEAVTILSQIGHALQYAHQQNVVHRDLKPENILFNARGEALLADFGIATILLTSSIKHTTSITGSPYYMAPEQFRGTISKEADQYALGCIAYELFTGHRPFVGPDFFAIGFKHWTDPPIAPRRLNPQLPAHIEQAILRAMAKERTSRYTDTSAFIAALNISPVQPSMSTPSLSRTPNVVKRSGKQLRLDAAQLTDVGRKREHNEDNMAYVIPRDAQVMTKKGALFIVADGIGGHAAGEVASEIAVDTVSNVYYQDDSDDVATSLIHAIKRANASIHQRAQENMLRLGMGTTCVAAVLRGNMVYIANVGDSRAYLVRGNSVKQISQDHSWAAEQMRAGLLTEDQARTHRYRNALTRTLGTQTDVDIDIFYEQLEERDSLVLCTKGLWQLVSNDEILRIVNQYVPQESVYQLVERANENGGPDNITVQVVRVQEVGVEPPTIRISP